MSTLGMCLSEASAQVGTALVVMGTYWESLKGFASSAFEGAFWENLKGFANSAFTTSLAGAFGGAYAAQKTAEKSKIRDELIKEIHHINSSLIMSMSIINTALSIKNQHIMALKNKYDEDLERYELHRAKVKLGVLAKKSPFKLTINLMTIPPIHSPIVNLQETVLGKTSCSGRPLALVSALGDAVTHYNSTVEKMNSLISSYKIKNIPQGASVESLYLGLRNEEGNANYEYRDTVKGLYAYTNDMIFFAMQLFEDLRKYGLNIVDKNKKIIKGVNSGIVSMDMDEAQKTKLLPIDRVYDEWLEGWKEAEPQRKPWWRLGKR